MKTEKDLSKLVYSLQSKNLDINKALLCIFDSIENYTKKELEKIPFLNLVVDAEKKIKEYRQKTINFIYENLEKYIEDNS